MRTDRHGGQFCLCQFPDGSVCEEWALKECSPSSNLSDNLILNIHLQTCSTFRYQDIVVGKFRHVSFDDDNLTV